MRSFRDGLVSQLLLDGGRLVGPCGTAGGRSRACTGQGPRLPLYGDTTGDTGACTASLPVRLPWAADYGECQPCPTTTRPRWRESGLKGPGAWTLALPLAASRRPCATRNEKRSRGRLNGLVPAGKGLHRGRRSRSGTCAGNAKDWESPRSARRGRTEPRGTRGGCRACHHHETSGGVQAPGVDETPG